MHRPVPSRVRDVVPTTSIGPLLGAVANPCVLNAIRSAILAETTSRGALSPQSGQLGSRPGGSAVSWKDVDVSRPVFMRRVRPFNLSSGEIDGHGTRAHLPGLERREFPIDRPEQGISLPLFARRPPYWAFDCRGKVRHVGDADRAALGLANRSARGGSSRVARQSGWVSLMLVVTLHLRGLPAQPALCATQRCSCLGQATCGAGRASVR